jgi:hypothetical protein
LQLSLHSSYAFGNWWENKLSAQEKAPYGDETDSHDYDEKWKDYIELGAFLDEYNEDRYKLRRRWHIYMPVL